MGHILFHQSFSLLDIPRVLVVIFLECVLSADNAIALAFIVKQLPEDKRSKALWIGSFSALILRAFALIFASFFIHYFWVQLIGACYLFYIASTFYLRSKKKHSPKIIKKNIPFWKIVLQIELTDFLFAIDSVVAALGLIHLQAPKGGVFLPKLWIVYVGGLFGLLIMRSAAKAFAKFIEKFPKLELCAHLLVGWIALKLCFEAMKTFFDKQPLSISSHYVLNTVEIIFWIGIVGLIIFALIPPKKSKRF